MRTQTNTQQDSTSSIIVPPIQCRMPWDVISVKAFANFRLKVCFVDGTEGIVDLSKLVSAPDAGVFAALV
jgi:hypothetical protein